MKRACFALLASLVAGDLTPSHAALDLREDETIAPPSGPAASPPPRPAAPPRPRPRPPAPQPESARPAPVPPPTTPVEPGEPGWLSDLRSRCSVWVPDPQPDENVSWSGP